MGRGQMQTMGGEQMHTMVGGQQQLPAGGQMHTIGAGQSNTMGVEQMHTIGGGQQHSLQTMGGGQQQKPIGGQMHTMGGGQLQGCMPGLTSEDDDVDDEDQTPAGKLRASKRKSALWKRMNKNISRTMPLDMHGCFIYCQKTMNVKFNEV